MTETRSPTRDALLVDGFGRVADDLRISVTDRCNLRCVYCMPAEGMAWLERGDILTYEEVERLARVFVRHGVRTIRLTGGEPLVRRDLAGLVRRLASIEPRPELALTTNGIRLAGQAAALREAGLDRVNVSLDSLRRDRNMLLTRRDSLERTLEGMRAARAAGLDPVKVNCVLMRSVNDDEVRDFLDFARREGFEVRFIEYMPLDADGRWTLSDVYTATELLTDLESEAVPVTAARPEPASEYALADGARFGVIPSVTAPFCSTCNRLRLTAEGGFRTCLFALDSTDLRDPLRSGEPDAAIEALILRAVERKWAGHHIGRPDFVRPDKSMGQIGG